MNNFLPNCLLPTTLSNRRPAGVEARENEAARNADPSALLSLPAHWNKPDVATSLRGVTKCNARSQ